MKNIINKFKDGKINKEALIELEKMTAEDFNPETYLRSLVARNLIKQSDLVSLRSVSSNAKKIKYDKYKSTLVVIKKQLKKDGYEEDFVEKFDLEFSKRMPVDKSKSLKE